MKTVYRKSDLPMDGLYNGYLSCRRRKRHTQQEQLFSFHVTTNLNCLRNEILYESYRPSPVRSFLIRRPVLREIFAPEFRDRVDQHYIAAKLEPLFEKEFIYDCYSCRKGKGTHFGIKRLRRFIAQCSRNYTRDCYILMGDIKGYFMSIDRARLWRQLEEFIRMKYTGEDTEKLLYQVRTFLFTSPLNHTVIRGSRKAWSELPDNKSVFACCGAPKPCDYNGDYTMEMDVNQKGLTIGALPAQIFGNFYLTPFDHYCKHDLQLRFYGRYVDDFFVVHTDKAYLLFIVSLLRSCLQSMGLTLHPHKIRILHYKQGIPFLGAYLKGRILLPGRRIRAGFRLLLYQIDNLPDSAKHEKSIEQWECRFNSYLGMLRQFQVRHYMKRMLDKHPRCHFFFHLTDSPYKAVSYYRLYERRHRYVWKKTMQAYHIQFRKKNADHAFYRKNKLYQLVYSDLFNNNTRENTPDLDIKKELV